MKILILIFALLAFWGPIPATSAAENESYYAKVMETGVSFYSSASDGSGVFNLPVSYYVEIYDREGSFYKARYMDLTGYVKINGVVPIKEKPQQPYPSPSLMVSASKGVDLIETPNLSGNVLDSLPHQTANITYYGYIGDASQPSWFYCSYNDEQGYIYSNDCEFHLELNYEDFTPITGELFANSSSPSKGLSATAKTFIILGVSLPCALIIFLLIKPSLSGQSIKTKVKRPKRRHGDYFEFDENDLA